MNPARVNRIRDELGLPGFDLSRVPGSYIGSILKPGDLFGIIIFKITGQRTLICGICGQHMAQMNKWGWLGCLRPKNRKQIIGWLCEEAARRGHQIDGVKMLALFKAAFKELRSKSVSSVQSVVN